MESDPETWTWPSFDEQELVERLEMDEEAFGQVWVGMADQMPVREFTSSAFEIGSGYPWPRPEGSFLLVEGEGEPLAALEPAERDELVARLTGPASGRTPMLSIGSNGSPEGLWRKFAHFEDAADRTLIAVRGHLHDFDVGASAELALYGALPATIFPSPGTRVSCTAVWLTPTQLTQLAWSEIPYWIGRLETRFEFEPLLANQGEGRLDRALIFVNRFGAFAPEGHPLALAAIPAEGRTAPAMSQGELLTLLAELALGQGSTAEALVQQAFEQPSVTGPLVTGIMRSNSIPFESDRWTRFPANRHLPT